METIKCPHKGEVGWLSPKVQAALEDNRLSNSDRYHGVCDTRVPLQVSFFAGQDIGCVGPLDSACPHPEHAQIISTDDVE